MPKRVLSDFEGCWDELVVPLDVEGAAVGACVGSGVDILHRMSRLEVLNAAVFRP